MVKLIVKMLLICGCIVVITSVSSSQENEQSSQVQSLQQQMSKLQAQVEQLQAEIKRLSGSETTAPSRPFSEQQATSSQQGAKDEVVTRLNQSTSREAGKQVSTYVIVSEDPDAAPRIDNAPLDPRFPGYFRLPGTETLLKIGGYFKSDFIRDIRPAGDTERFIPSGIPIPSNGGTTNSTVSVRPTRLNLDFLIPLEKTGSVRFFLEGDLFGSSSTTPRMRHAYAQVQNFLIGQTFSNFQDPDAGPDQLDFQGPNAQVSIRNPQFRYTIPLAAKTSIRLALEKASSDVAFKTPQFSALPSNQAPDGTLTFRHDGELGHIQISGLFRSVGAFLPNGVSDSVFGWGINGSGALKTFGSDTAVAQVAYGHGIERYLNDTSGLGIDATVISTQNPHLRPLPVLAAYGSYQHYWFDKLRSSAMYGFVEVENTPFQPDSAFHHSNYTAANLIWNAVGSLNVGVEFLYGWTIDKNHASGNAPRLMLSAKYSFVKSKKSK